MSLKTLVHLILATGMFASVAFATCQAENDSTGGKETDTKLCLGQGAGDWTFALSISMVCVPAGGDGGFAGCAGANIFYIFDEDCNIRGQYDSPDCGTPFIIEENFLADVLTVTSINLDSGYFSFLYGDGKYSIGNNQCDCVADNDGLEGGTACKCAFPVDGISTKKREQEAAAVLFKA